MLKIVKFYKIFFSPFFGCQCRFYPTCSEYFSLAVKKYGFLRGFYKTILRLLRCNPFCSGGIDYP